MIDLRRIRIGIEVLGQINWYEDQAMRVKATGTKYASPLKNECTVTITGLSKQTRDYILTETSPFNANRTPKRLIVEAGRISTGVFRLFVGDIIEAEQGPPPDLELTVKAKTQNAQSGNIVSTSTGPLTLLSVLARKVATDLGLELQFQATDKNVSNYAHTGSALAQVQKLQQAGGVTAFIDDTVLIVKDAARALAGQVRILNKDSGMVGIPKLNEKGVVVEFLIDPDTAIGGTLRIESGINPALNGDYLINQLAFDVSSHDTPFFYKATASRL